MGLAADTCRLCANTGNLCVPVFGKDGDENLLRHKLRICSPIIVKESDKFPTQVCITCLSSLDQCYEFYQLIKSAQHKLQAMLEMDDDKRRLSDSDSTQPLKRQCFGSTVLTYPAGSHDLLNLKDTLTTEQKSPPLFVMVNGSKSHPNDDQSIKKEEPKTPIKSTPRGPISQPKEAQLNLQSEMAKLNSPDKAGKQNELPKRAQENPSKLLEPNVAVQPNMQKNDTQSNASSNAQAPVTELKELKSPCPPTTDLRTTYTTETSVTEDKTANVLPTSRPSVAEPKELDASSNVPVVSDNSNEPQPEDMSSADQSMALDTTEPCDTPSLDIQFKSCRFCERQFPEESLAEHEALHPQGRKVFSCVQCNRSFFFEEAYRRHVARHERQAQSSSA